MPDPTAPDDARRTPIFLFSLPRSGSTLLQRIIATHPDVATSPEPTFLLPLLHIGSDSQVVATFDQRFTAMAIEDFLKSTGDPTGTFDAMVLSAADVAYSHASPGGARFFLDKTPKYHMVSSDIIRIFADSPVIVLWRNPLAVIASLLATWGGGGGRWNLHHFRLDLFVALPRLIEVASDHPERVHTLRYEDLVDDPERSMTALFEHIGLDIADSDMERFATIDLPGRVQDPNVGTQGFTTVRSDRIDQWKIVLSNPIRKAWCRRYLRQLGAERLAAMGYQLDDLLAELDAISSSTRFLASDLVLVPFDTIYRVLEVGVFTKKLRSFRGGRRQILAHK